LHFSFSAASSVGAWACAPGAVGDVGYTGGSMAFRIVTVSFDNERGVFPDNEPNNFLLDKKVKNYRVEDT